jgi:hypothetical protein
MGRDGVQSELVKKTNVPHTFTGREFLEFYDKLGQKLIRYWVVRGLRLFSASLAREGPLAVEMINE